MKHLTLIITLIFNSFCLLGQYDVISDSTFGINGITTLPYRIVANQGVHLQSDGKLVLMVKDPDNPTEYFSLRRLNTDGSLDSSYNNGGVNNAPGLIVGSLAGAMLPNNDLIVVGRSNLIPDYPAGIVVYKYFENGNLDDSFGDNGLVMLPDSTYFLQVLGLELDSDSSMLLFYGGTGLNNLIDYGYFICRLGIDGRIDSTFADNGIYMVPKTLFRQVLNMRLNHDGAILMFGRPTNSSTGTIYKINPDLSIDPGYQITGAPANMNIDNFYGLDEDGKLILRGGINWGINRIVRLMPDGSLDSSFNKVGMIDVTMHHRLWGIPINLIEQNDGKLLFQLTGGVAAMRLNPNGTLDYSFGLNGITFIPSTFTEGPNSSGLIIQPDNKLVSMAKNQAQQVMVFRLISRS